MQFVVSHFWCAKKGSADTEYEDALARGPAGARLRRFAVADGASESSFAGLWARLLARAYARGALAPETLIEGLRPLQAWWQRRVGARPLPWYAAEKVRAGAFAALAGLTLACDGRWSALAAGDCCVFQVRDDALMAAFPLADAAAFDRRPLLIGSNPERNGRLAEAVRFTEGGWEPGDTFLLMSDAAAAYLLRGVVDRGRTVSGVLAYGGSACAFRAWIDCLRATGAMRNDDVSVLKVQVV
jgi:hypothetical protein